VWALLTNAAAASQHRPPLPSPCTAVRYRSATIGPLHQAEHGQEYDDVHERQPDPRRAARNPERRAPPAARKRRDEATFAMFSGMSIVQRQ
jgi:hypothetical protein